MVASYFDQNLNYLMKEQGIKSVNELSRLCGIATSTFGNWRTRKNIPGADQLEVLAKFFNVEPYYFLMKPGSQGLSKPTERDDSWDSFANYIAETTLTPEEREEYDEYGPREYLLNVRANYETQQTFHPPWFLKMNAGFTTYFTLDLVKKLENALRESSLRSQETSKAKSS